MTLTESIETGALLAEAFSCMNLDEVPDDSSPRNGTVMRAVRAVASMGILLGVLAIPVRGGTARIA